MKRVNYRKLAFEHYRDRLVCVHCGFGIREVLEVAHVDCQRQNNEVANLVLLCPTCHKMYDLGLIPTATIKDMRDTLRTVSWTTRMKDAGKKAALSRKNRTAATRRKRRLAALKAAATRARNRMAKAS